MTAESFCPLRRALNESPLAGELVRVDSPPTPCEVVFFSKYGGPVLRDAILATGDSAPFADFAQAFMQGPIDLATRPHLRRQLMV